MKAFEVEGDKAADVIIALQARIQELEGALEGIAKGQWNTIKYRKNGVRMQSVGEFARAALTGKLE